MPRTGSRRRFCSSSSTVAHVTSQSRPRLRREHRIVMADATLTDVRAVNGASGSWLNRNKFVVTPWLFLAPGNPVLPVLRDLPDLSVFSIMSLYEWDGLGEARVYRSLATIRNCTGHSMIATHSKSRSSTTSYGWFSICWRSLPVSSSRLFLNQTVTGIRLYKSLFFFPFVISVRSSSVWCSPGSTTPHSALLNSCCSALLACRPLNVLGDDPTLCHLRHHSRRPLATDRLLHDPLPDRPQRSRSGADRSRQGWMAPRAGACSGTSSCRNCARRHSLRLS